jgi:hypothetical protein
MQSNLRVSVIDYTVLRIIRFYKCINKISVAINTNMGYARIMQGVFFNRLLPTVLSSRFFIAIKA